MRVVQKDAGRLKKSIQRHRSALRLSFAPLTADFRLSQICLTRKKSCSLKLHLSCRARRNAASAIRWPRRGTFCGNDLLAVGALSAILDAGLNVPDDIGLIDLNDMEMDRWLNNGLTTIRQPIDQIIAAAIDLGIAAIASLTLPPQTCIFPCTLIERQTLRPARA